MLLPPSLAAVFQLCCYMLSFPTEPHGIPGWSGIARGALSLSQSVHAEVFLRRRSARDAFYFFYQPLLFFTSNSVSFCLLSFAVFFFNLVGSSYYLFVRATNCFGRCGHKHTIISWISCFFVTHTQGVVMLEDGDLKQNKERLSRTFSSSVLLLFVLLSFKIFHRVTQLFLLLSLKTAVCLCHSRKKKVVGKEQWELVLVHYALAIIIITIFRC